MRRRIALALILFTATSACGGEVVTPVDEKTTPIEDVLPMASTTTTSEVAATVPPTEPRTTAKPRSLVATTAKPAPAPTSTTTTASPPPTIGIYYANCNEVRAAGAAPIRRGEPGYRSGLDRDGDGTACDT